MDNLGKNWQLINILFCGYQRRLEIGDCRSTKCDVPKPILARGTGAPASNKVYKIAERSRFRKNSSINV